MSLVKLSIVLAAAAWHESAPAEAQIPSLELPPVQERGLASWYGDGALHGRQTASGELIDPARYTCAHRTRPLQSTVLLVNAEDPARRVWCRINDRGPFGARLEDGSYVVKTHRDQPGKWRGVIDISVAAARELGTHEKGLQAVEIRYWREEPRQRPSIAIAPVRRRDE